MCWMLAQHASRGVTMLLLAAQAAGRAESRLDAEVQEEQDAAEEVAAARARARLQDWREIDRCATPSMTDALFRLFSPVEVFPV